MFVRFLWGRSRGKWKTEIASKGKKKDEANGRWKIRGHVLRGRVITCPGDHVLLRAEEKSIRLL